LAVSAVLVGISGPAAAYTPWWARSTWPPITVVVTTENGWVVASGNPQGEVGPSIWKVSLAPAGPALVVQHGISTTLVAVGPRQFVVDDASGQSTELRGGAVYRQWGPRVAAPPPAPLYVRQVLAAQPPSLTPAQKAALEAAATTQNRLQAALDRLNKLAETGPAGSEALAEARLAAQAARIDVSLAMARVKDEFGSASLPAPLHPASLPTKAPAAIAAPAPRPAPAAQPAPPPLTRDEAISQGQLLQAQANLQRSIMGLNLLRDQGAPPTDIATARAKIPLLHQAEEDALAAFHKSQLEAEIQRSQERAGELDLATRFQLYEDLYRILRLTRERYRAQTLVQDLRAQKGDGAADTARFNRAADDLAQAITKLASAQRDFASLAAKAAGKKSGAGAPPVAMGISG
jgi:hypothetical protein